jgi:hypothetical protein
MNAWHVFGLDLGQTSDFSALALLARDRAGVYAVTHLRRWQLGTRYTDVVRDVAALTRKPPLHNPPLVVDGTGVGAAVVDLFLEADMPGRVVPVVITGGARASLDAETGRLHVPKRELASTLQVLMQSRRLVVARGVELAETLAREMANFKVKVTASANETYEAWRSGDKDDLVLAVAVAAWVAERAWATSQEEYDGGVVITA